MRPDLTSCLNDLRLRAAPWPDPADPPGQPFGQWFCDSDRRLLSRCLSAHTRLIVELGSFEGASALWLLAAAPSATLVCVDTWDETVAAREPDPALRERFARLWPTFAANLWPHRERVIPLRMPTDRALQIIAACGAGPLVDLVYVDAGHDYAEARADLAAAIDLCPAAAVVLDDYHPHFPGVVRAADEVAAERGLWLSPLPKAARIERPTAKIISACHFNRPDYTRQHLAALRDCLGIEEYTYLAMVDAGAPAEVIELLRGIDFCRAEIEVHADRHGCTRNTLKTLDYAFRRAEYVIHVEDDVLLSRDALVWFAWANRRFADPAGGVLNVSGYSKDMTGGLHHYGQRAWFSPWGWATWRDRWQAVRPNLDYDGEATWDVQLHHRGGWPVREIYPLFSRAQNIGAHGTYVPDPAWHAQHQHAPRFAGPEVAAEPWTPAAASTAPARSSTPATNGVLLSIQ